MKRAQAAVAAVALLAAAACLYLIVEAGRQIYRTIGPSKAVATHDGKLMLVSHGAIHVFGPDRRRLHAFALEKLGASRTPSDMAVHRDGRVVLTDPDSSHLRRCTLPQGPCELLDPGLAKVPAQRYLPLNAVKLSVADEVGRYYISDNYGHRLVIADFAGKALAATPRGSVIYPNQLGLTAPGELTVVDTNHRRLATFDVSGDKVGRVVRSMSTDTDGMRPGRLWPFDAIHAPDGRTWVLVAREGMKDADLVIFDGGSVERRIDLGEDSDPFDIELWGGRVIVADATRYRVDAVAPDGTVQRAFDDAAFDRELAAARELPDRWRAIRLAAQVGIVAIPLSAILVLMKLGLRPALVARPAPVQAQAAPLTAEPQWLEVDPAIAQRAHRSMQPFLLLIAILMGVMVFLFHDAFAGSPKLLLQVGLFLLVLVVAVVARPRANAKTPSRFRALRLGASQRGLHYELPKGMAFVAMKPASGVAPWKHVYYDGGRLLANGTAIPVKQPLFGELFEPQRFAALVVANIPPRNLLTPAQLGRRAMAAQGPLAWVVLALLVAALATWLLVRTSL